MKHSKSPSKWILAGLALTMAVIAGELIFGSWIFNDRIDPIDKPSQQAQVLPQSGDTVSRNDYGLRGNYETPKDIDVLVVGGTYDSQDHLPDGSTWQDLVEQRFAHNNQTIHFANAAVTGYSSIENILSFDLWFKNIPDLSPRYIVFSIGVDDLYVTPKRHKQLMTVLEQKDSLTSLIFFHGFFYDLYRQSARLVDSYLQSSLLSFREIPFKPEDFVDSKGMILNFDIYLKEPLEHLNTRLKVLAQKAKALGAQPIFITQRLNLTRPSEDLGTINTIGRKFEFEEMTLNGYDLDKLIVAYNQTILDTCQAEHFSCFDLPSAANLKTEDFYDYVHLRPEGTQKQAAAVFAYLDTTFSQNQAL